MAVRVNARLIDERTGRFVETSLFLNAGYEAPSPRVLLPKGLANALGLAEEGRLIEARTSVGVGILRGLDVKLRIEVEGRSAEAEVRVSDFETEAVANDALIEAPGIEILRPKEGLYKFADDPPGTFRKGISPKLW